MRLNELRAKRSAALEKMQNILTSAESAERDLNKSEAKEFEQLKTEERSLRDQIDRAEYLQELQRNQAKPVDTAEKRSFEKLASGVSVAKVIQAQVAGKSLTGLEAEYAQEAEHRSGKKAQGIYVPMAALETRANTTTSAAELVGTDHRADQYIGALRNRLLARQLGVRVLSGLQGDVSIPKYGTGMSSGWVTEGSAVGESDMTFDAVTMTPKHVGGRTEMSRQLIMQGSPDIEQLIRDDLGFLIAQAIDSAILLGDGTGGSPTGILNTVGIQTHSAAAPTITDLHTMIELAELANVSPNYFLGGTSVKRVLATTVKETGVDSYLLENNMLGGLPFRSSNQVVDKTGSPDTGRLILGDFSQAMLGIWSEIDLLVNPYSETAYNRGGVVVRAMATCDVAVRHPEAFVVADDITL